MEPQPYANTTCPYHSPGLKAIWQRGRRDAAEGIYHIPDRRAARGALEAYRHGWKLGTIESRARP